MCAPRRRWHVVYRTAKIGLGARVQSEGLDNDSGCFSCFVGHTCCSFQSQSAGYSLCFRLTTETCPHLTSNHPSSPSLSVRIMPAPSVALLAKSNERKNSNFHRKFEQVRSIVLCVLAARPSDFGLLPIDRNSKEEHGAAICSWRHVTRGESAREA